MSIYYIPHGGGPMPLMNHPSQHGVTSFLKSLHSEIQYFHKRIVIFSAHYEASPIEVQTNPSPGLLYDYTGFPPETYHYEYPASIDREFSQKVFDLFLSRRIPIRQNSERGLDHGIFVPLKLIMPDCELPIVSISLHASLDPQAHLEMGKILSELDDGKTLWIGSGSSSHNLRFMISGDPSEGMYAAKFNDWLKETLDLTSQVDIHEKLSNWRSAPMAEFVHPRAEHLIPLHICQGLAEGLGYPAEQILETSMMGQVLSAWNWS